MIEAQDDWVVVELFGGGMERVSIDKRRLDALLAGCEEVTRRALVVVPIESRSEAQRIGTLLESLVTLRQKLDGG